MCGIGCYFCPLGTDAFSATNLNRRGPDSHQSCTVNFEDYTIVFLRYLLHIRGDAVCVPSIQNPEVGVFLFNGELYNSDVDESHGDTVHFWHSIKSSGVIATCQGECSLTLTCHCSNSHDGASFLFICPPHSVKETYSSIVCVFQWKSFNSWNFFETYHLKLTPIDTSFSSSQCLPIILVSVVLRRFSAASG